MKLGSKCFWTRLHNHSSSELLNRIERGFLHNVWHLVDIIHPRLKFWIWIIESKVMTQSYGVVLFGTPCIGFLPTFEIIVWEYLVTHFNHRKPQGIPGNNVETIDLSYSPRSTVDSIDKYKQRYLICTDIMHKQYWCHNVLIPGHHTCNSGSFVFSLNNRFILFN